MKRLKPKLTAVDLFCGCGAVTEGLKKRFKVIAAVDNDSTAAASYKANHPSVCFFEEDITQLSPAKLLQEHKLSSVDLLVVCAPCQPFSSQNQSSGKDGRIPLILESIRFARHLQPKLIFFENVAGLLSPKYSSLIEELKKGLENLGYANWLGPEKIDAANYSVPQRRVRSVLVAGKNEIPLPSLPKPTTPVGRRQTVSDAISDLPPLSSGESSEDDPLHFARNHRTIALQRFQKISKDGGSRFELPEELELPCHKGYKGHPDVYGRMSWGDVAPTLTSGCTDATRGRFIHPVDDRSISLREAARLQTFPDDFDFRGSPGAISLQIGNAVPVKMVRVFSDLFAKALS